MAEEVTSPLPTRKTPRRKWLRFSLRTLLLLTAAFCLWLGLVFVPIQRSDRATALLEQRGVSVGYDYQRVGSNHGYTTLVPEPGSPFLRSILGKGFFQSADSLHLSHKPLAPEDARVIARIPTVASIWLEDCGIGDEQMAHFSNLHDLDYLLLRGNHITNEGMKHLQKLTKLKTLELTGNKIDDDGLVYIAGLTNLENLWLDGTQITDAGLKHLANLNKLKMLSVQRTNVLRAGAENFRLTHPKCSVQPYFFEHRDYAEEQRKQREETMKAINKIKAALKPANSPTVLPSAK